MIIVQIVLLSAAFIPTEEGTNPEYWASRSVVFAKLLDVRDSQGRTYLLLEPRGTLTGSFDTGTQPQVRARVSFGHRGTSIETVPTKGAYVLVVLQLVAGEYCVPTSCVTYMPGMTPLLSVTDFNDPQVKEALTRIWDERSKKGHAQSRIKLPTKHEGRSD